MLKYISLITITYCVIAHEDHSFDSTEISTQNRRLRSKHIYPNIPHRIKNPPTANQRSSSNFGSPVAVTDPADISHLLGKTNRGSYMSAHVLLNLLNELRKRDKMRGLPSIFFISFSQ